VFLSRILLLVRGMELISYLVIAAIKEDSIYVPGTSIRVKLCQVFVSQLISAV